MYVCMHACIRMYHAHTIIHSLIQTDRRTYRLTAREGGWCGGGALISAFNSVTSNVRCVFPQGVSTTACPGGLTCRLAVCMTHLLRKKNTSVTKERHICYT